MAPTVLIIGDDMDTHILLRQALADRGYRIYTMPDRQCALFPAGRVQSDLIIFDSLWPGTNGWEALPRIRHLSAVPIIALTDAAHRDVKIDSLDRGADCCLIKPFDVREFQARVRALLRRNGSRELDS